MNNDLCIIFAVEGNRLLVDIRRVSYSACSAPNKYLYKPRHLSRYVCDFRIGSATLPGAPKALPSAPTCSQTYHNHSQLLLYNSSEIPVTLKAGQNALLGSDTLLKLTLLSLHSTSSQTLLESSRDKNTFC